MNDPIRQHLSRLPEPSPDPALWSRVNAARQGQFQRRRVGLAMVTVASAGLGVFATLDPLPRTVAPKVASSAVEAPASDIAESAIARIDRDLQLAYARNADDAEIAALWTLRQGVLKTGTSRPIGI